MNKLVAECSINLKSYIVKYKEEIRSIMLEWVVVIDVGS